MQHLKIADNNAIKIAKISNFRYHFKVSLMKINLRNEVSALSPDILLRT